MQKVNMLIRLSFLLSILISCIAPDILTAQTASKPEFINKLVEELSPEEKSINESYLERKIKETKKDRLSLLIELLKNPEYLFLPRKALAEVGKHAIPPLRDVLTDKKNSIRTRTEALKALRDLSDKDAYILIDDQIKPIPPVYDREQAEFQNVYLEMKLQGLENTKKLNVLIEMLRDKNKTRLAREALIQIGKPAVPRLIAVLKEKENPFISRLDALWSLKEIKDVGSVHAVMEILKDTEETDQLRDLAAYTLGELGDEKAIPMLEEIVRDWKPGVETGPYNVGKSAEEALRKIKK